MDGTRVIIADTDKDWRREVQEQVKRYGCLVVASLENGRSAAQLIFEREPDVAILNTWLPGRTGLEVSRVVGEQLVCAVVLVAEKFDWEVIGRVGDTGAQAFLIKPVGEQILIPAMETAMAGFRRYKEAVQENRRLKEELETRRLVERAKGLLMRRHGWEEDQAYNFLRQQSMKRGLPMRRLAKAVLDGHLGPEQL